MRPTERKHAGGRVGYASVALSQRCSSVRKPNQHAAVVCGSCESQKPGVLVTQCTHPAGLLTLAILPGRELFGDAPRLRLLLLPLDLRSARVRAGSVELREVTVEQLQALMRGEIQKRIAWTPRQEQRHFGDEGERGERTGEFACCTWGRVEMYTETRRPALLGSVSYSVRGTARRNDSVKVGGHAGTCRFHFQ